jgi:hypothetical protein
MAKLSRDSATPPGGAATLHAREALITSGNFGAANAEIILPADSCGTVSLDLRGTFNLTVEVAGTVDGVNWTPVPVRPVNQASIAYVATVAGSAAGVWVGSCAGYRSVRARCTAFTSGSAATVLSTSNAPLDQTLSGTAIQLGTNTGAAAAAVTLTLASPGAGLRHYLTFIDVERVNATAAALTAVAGPNNVTTTNLSGSPVIPMSNDALAAGATERVRKEFNYPLAAFAQNTATTVVASATTGVIWRITAGFFVAP